ncbi:MAG: 2-keto-4-pentenoate hydratase [Pseudomonadota bacterium]
MATYHSPNSANEALDPDALDAIAERFVAARRSATTLSEFPGRVPPTLSTAYQVQDRAIELWPDTIVGWKVGQIRPDAQPRFGSDRMIGPLFERHVHHALGTTPLPMPLPADGFAAVEAEFVAVIGTDAPPDKTTWTVEESLAMVAELRIGLETAGSPLPGLPTHGAAAVVADFGAHAGLIVGPTIDDWRQRDLSSLAVEAFVDGVSVGHGGAFRLQGGIARSLQVTLEVTARRGRALKTGDLVSTGATSGVHAVSPGQIARLDFGRDGELTCSIFAAQPIGS